MTLRQPIFATPKESDYFFGYYDKTPLNYTNQYLLTHRADFHDRAPVSTDTVEVGYFDLHSGADFHCLGKSATWNWQQGAMLQWLPPSYSELVVYNVFNQGQYQSVISDLSGQILKRLPRPIYCLHPNGQHALSIDYERYYWIRPGYHYKGLEVVSKKTKAPENDGIWRLDLKSGESDQIVQLGAVMQISPTSSFGAGLHWLEHIVYNPSGTRFMFYHRVRSEENQVLSRLFTVAADGSDLRLVLDSGRLTHASWRNNYEIILYGGVPSPISGAIKNSALLRSIRPFLTPIYRALTAGANSSTGTSALSRLATGDCYMLIQDANSSVSKLDVNVLNKDGHPSFCSRSPDLMLSDTYPDPSRDYLQELFMYNLQTGVRTVIASHRHPLRYYDTAQRCDFHPRWSLDGSQIVIDVLTESGRSVEVYSSEIS